MINIVLSYYENVYQFLNVYSCNGATIILLLQIDLLVLKPQYVMHVFRNYVYDYILLL